VAHAIAVNVRRMAGVPELPEQTQKPICRRRHIGFLTLTVGDQKKRKFVQVWDALEASRRMNSLLTGWLRGLFLRSIIVTERHKTGAIHFHLVVETRAELQTAGGKWTPALKSIHRKLRERLPGYGFGRAELTPLKKAAGAVATYLAKYVAKSMIARRDEDVGRRLVRYSGWEKSHLKPNEFGWFIRSSVEWRERIDTAVRICGFSDCHTDAREEVRDCYGPRWAFRLTRALAHAERGMVTDDVRENVLVLRECMGAEEVNPEWRIWRDRELWADYCAKVDASAAAQSAGMGEIQESFPL